MVAITLLQLNESFTPASTLALLVAAGCLWLAVDYGVIHRHAWLSAAFLLLGVERLLAAALALGGPAQLADLVLVPLSAFVLVALAVVLGRVVVGRLVWLLGRWVHGQTSTSGD